MDLRHLRDSRRSRRIGGCFGARASQKLEDENVVFRPLNPTVGTGDCRLESQNPSAPSESVRADYRASRAQHPLINEMAAQLQATEQIQNQNDDKNGSDYAVRPVAEPITACRESAD